MAYQVPNAFQGLAASAADRIPSLTSSVTSPWRSLAGQIPRRQSRDDESTTTQHSPLPASDEAKPERSVPDVSPHSIANEAFELLTSHPRYAPSREALKHDYTVQNIISSFGKQPPASTPNNTNNAPSHTSTRGYSSSSTTPFGPFNLRPAPFQAQFTPAQRRMMSNQPSSHNLLAHMEQTANNNPQSPSSQNAFYAALLRANMPEILVERYETGRYATNPACDAMYYRALERLGHSGGSAAQAGPAAVSQAPITPPGSMLNQEQIQSISRAVAASQRGGSSTAVPQRGRDGNYGSGARGNPLHVVVNESNWQYMFKIFRFILVYGITGYFILVVLSFAVEASGVLRKAGGPQNAEVKPEKQKTRFSDVKGCDEAIEELREVVDFLKSPEKYNKLGGKLPKGVLMVGPPGTGKTLLARAVAGEAGVPFFYMSGAEFDEVYVGVGAKRVRDLFQNAKSKAPAIVFIDEIEAIGGKRNARDAAYHMQTLNQMLTELDGFDQTSGVVFIGATNFPQMLDKALTRPGRFDRRVVVSLPDVRGRLAILKHHTRSMQIGKDVDPELIARGTPGFSGADLENLVNQAAVHASKLNARSVDMRHMDWARDKIIMGAERKSMIVTDEDKLMTAYHEAGHALVSHFTKGCSPLYKITILPRGQALGVTHSLPDMDRTSSSKMQLLGQIDMSFGGKIAEELIYGPENVTTGCASDLQAATATAYHMVTEAGMSEALGTAAFGSQDYTLLSTDKRNQIDREVQRILDEAQNRARKVLREKSKELDLLAKALIKHETLTKEEMIKVINGEALPETLSLDMSSPIKLPEIPIPPNLGGTDGSTGGSDGVKTGS